MNMTSRLTLLASTAGIIWAGCSAPAEDGPIPPMPTAPPPGFQPGAGQQVTPGAGGTGAGVTPVGAVGGTGGSAIAAAGGTGAATPPAAGGAGMTPPPAAADIPSGEGLAITHAADGWVAGTTNAVGIQGVFHPISDDAGTPPGDTSVTLGDFAASPTSVCLSGEASAVLEMDFTRYWGGGLGLNLADPGGMVGPMPWSAGSVTGFSFSVTGAVIPANLRFNATTPAGGVTYCTDIAAGPNTVTLSSLVTECWQAGGTAMAPATTPLESIQWQVVTTPDVSTPFDFCIENLTAITSP